jgi:capsular polysaccharide export protein
MNKKIAYCQSSGIKKIKHIENFLDVSAVKKISFKNLSTASHAVLVGWGKKKGALRLAEKAKKNKLPFYYLEDGFIRSSSSNPHNRLCYSMIIDPVGLYYDSRSPSLLEQILNNKSDLSKYLNDEVFLKSAQDLLRRIQAFEITKYNFCKDLTVNPFPEGKKVVLLVDQTYGDKSVEFGNMQAEDFKEMLDCALRENPQCHIAVKIHPDVLCGKKKGYLWDYAKQKNVQIVSDTVNPIGLLKKVHKVYAGTSQMGFEALLCGKPVILFGSPFYAGWGLTDDRKTLARRTCKRSLVQLFAAAYILYPKYCDPVTGEACELGDIIDHIVLQKQAFKANAGHLFCLGFTPWKRGYTRAFLRSPANEIRFINSIADCKKFGMNKQSSLVVWGIKNSKLVDKIAGQFGVDVWRVEDGFIRSAGLGSDFAAPASLCIDRSGIYFDPEKPSDLETLLSNKIFLPAELKRARALKRTIVEENLSKYNVQSARTEALEFKGEGVKILVIGQVEGDASLRRGSPEFQTNLAFLTKARELNPNNILIYKPHPDVLSGNRSGEVPFQALERLCDFVDTKNNISSLLRSVDEVHTLTSLTGFEALMRGVKVVVYGMPFYAGWGLTTDMCRFNRRKRRLVLDELVACTLINYPQYLNVVNGEFESPERIIKQINAEKSAPKMPVHPSRLRRQLNKACNLFAGLSYNP